MKQVFIKMPLAILFASALVLTSCGGGDSWWAGDAATEEDKMAQRICECMYNTFKEKGVNVDKMLEAYGTDAGSEGMKEDESNKKRAELMAEVKKSQEIDMTKTECGKSLNGEIEKQVNDKKLNPDKLNVALTNKCKVAAW